MPTRTYTNINLQNIVDEYFSFTSDSSISGTKFERNISGSRSGTSQAQVGISAELDFTVFPSIPASATITKVEITLSRSVVSAGPSGGGANYIFNLTLYQGYFATLLDHLSVNGTTPQNVTDEISFIDITPRSRTSLISLYSDLLIYFSNLAVWDGISAVSYSVTTSNFTLAVTYDLENYSWYIKPTVKIVNGQPVTIIENAITDIIQVNEGDPVPEGYIFYGTSVDFPTGPEYFWWSSVDFYLFYIYSPIAPSFGNYVWTQLLAPPACVGCLTLTLGALDILVADASGIYTLITNKTTDTLYVRPNGETIDVKIPNPTIRIGYLP